jgi:hypothetical protein
MAKPIPDDYPRVTPYLIVDGANAAIDFYSSILGALSEPSRQAQRRCAPLRTSSTVTGQASSRTRSGTAGTWPLMLRTWRLRRCPSA